MDDYGEYLQPDQSWPPSGDEDDYFYIKEEDGTIMDFVFDTLDQALEYLNGPSPYLDEHGEYSIVNSEDNSDQEWYKDEDNTIWWRDNDVSEHIEGEMVWSTNSNQHPREMYYYDDKVWIRYLPSNDEIWNDNDEENNEMVYYEGRVWTRYQDYHGNLPDSFTTDDNTGDEMQIDNGTKWFSNTHHQYWTDNDGNYMIYNEDTDMTWYRRDDDRVWNDNAGNEMFYDEVTDTMWYPHNNHIWIDDEGNEAYYDGHTMWNHDDQPALEQDPAAEYWVDNGGDKMWIDYDVVKWYYDGNRFWNREDGIEWFEFGHDGTKLYYPHPTRPPTENEYGQYFPHYYTKDV